MSEQVRCIPTSFIADLFSSYVHPLHGNPYSSHHIYHLAFSPMIVLIDVSLSHLFFFLLHHISLFAILSLNSRAYAHHCMSAQNIENEWIKLTCTWLVVWGRVKIR